MLDLVWEPRPFDRMQHLIDAHPELKAGFAYSLETLAIELRSEGNTWGESRSRDYRLGYVGVLSVLIRVNTALRIIRIVDVKLELRPRRG